MIDNKNATMESIKAAITDRRKAWRDIRTSRLNYKKKLADDGLDINQIRSNKKYKILKKEQDHLSKTIRHLEKRLNRFFH